ncbi:MAG: tyrosine-type recombinase/integrase [Bacteroidales bacterium]|nr:tyrosine-type recombinase/integrase [Bacteroidales bacterium]
MKTEEFLEYIKKERNYSDYTIRSYRIDLQQFISFIKDVNAQELLPDEEPSSKDIRLWLMQLKHDNISSRSINRKIATLRSYYRFLSLKYPEIFSQTGNPMAKIIAPKVAKRKISQVFEEDMQQLLEEVPNEDDFISFRNYFIIEILYCTGIRRSELLSLKNSDFNLQAKQIKVFGKGKKERIIPLGEKIIEHFIKYIGIKQRLNLNNEFLIVDEKNKVLSEYKLYYLVHKRLENINVGEKSPHVFRHTCATHLLNNGAEINNVKNLLGHTSLSATEVYTHTTIEQLKKEYKNSFKSINK